MIIGKKTLVGVSPEISYGDGSEVGDILMPVTSFKATQAHEFAEKEEYVGELYSDPSILVAKKYDLEFAFNLYPGNEAGYFLASFSGSPESSVISGASHKHIGNIKESDLAQKSLCVRHVEAGLACDKYVGVMVKEMNFSIEKRGLVKVTVKAGARDRVSGTLTGLVKTNESPYIGANAAYKFDNNMVKLDSCSFSLDNGIRLDNHKQGLLTEKPVYDGEHKAEAQLKFDAKDRTYRSLYENAATKKFQVILTHPSDIPGTSNKYGLTLELPAGQIASQSTEEARGVIPENITITARKGTSSNNKTADFEYVLSNGTSSY